MNKTDEQEAIEEAESRRLDEMLRQQRIDTITRLENENAQLKEQSRELLKDKERKAWLLSQCKVVHFIRDEANDLGNYPVEHHPLVGKCMIDDAYIDQALDKAVLAKGEV